MASITIKKLKNDTQALKQAVKDIREEFLLNAEKQFKRIIITDNILKGNSPVEGAGRYEKYSPSYEKAIKSGRYKKYGKTLRPVNLKLSGDMLDSFYTKKMANGIEVGFKDKKSEYHDRLGAGSRKVIRKMLPGEGQDFKSTIKRQILDLLVDAVSRISLKFK